MAATVVEPLRNLITGIISEIPSEEQQHAFAGIRNVLGGSYEHKENLYDLLSSLVVSHWMSMADVSFLNNCLSDKKEVLQNIQKRISHFKQDHRHEIDKYFSTLPREFVERDIEKEVDSAIFANNLKCVHIYGEAGVGKTTLLKGYLSRLEDEQDRKVRIVDMRSMDDTNVALVSFLLKFGVVTSVQDISVNFVMEHVMKLSEMYFVLFDNADVFLDEGSDPQKREEFLSFVDRITQGDSRIVALLTSRSKVSDGFQGRMYQKELEKLDPEKASEILKPALQSRGLLGELGNFSSLCGFNPLALNLLKGLLKEAENSPFDLKDNLQKSLKGSQAYGKEGEKVFRGEGSAGIYTEANLELSFSKLSDTLRLAAVSLSLFTGPFPYGAVRRVFDEFQSEKINTIMTALAHFNLINASFDSKDREKDLYDFHPEVRRFLQSKKDTISSFQERMKKYLSYFNSKLLSIARIFDASYKKAFDEFEKNRSDYRALFMNSFGQDAYIILDKYSDLQTASYLFEALIGSDQRLALYRQWAKDAEDRGDFLHAARCHIQAGVILSSQNPTAAIEESVKEAERLYQAHNSSSSFLAKVIPGTKRHEAFVVKHLLIALRSRCMFTLSRSDINNANRHKRLLESLKLNEQVIKQWSKIDPDNITELSRLYIYQGNICNSLFQLDRKGPWLARGEGAYLKALDMRTERFGTINHPDTPIVLQSLAVIFEVKGDEERAKEYYRKALQSEVELNLDGTLPTALILKNYADLLFNEDKYDEALPLAERSVEIRKRLLGNHPETVRSIYLVCVIIYSWAYKTNNIGRYRCAAQSYLEGIKMEESLQGLHSSVRYRLRKDLTDLYDTMLEEGFVDGAPDLRSWRKQLRELEVEETEGEKISENIRFYDFGVIKKEIGVSGGHLEFKALGVSVQIPHGAVDGDKTLSLECMNLFNHTLKNDYERICSDIILFHGTDVTFAKKCSISIPYRPEDQMSPHQKLVIRHIETQGGELLKTDLEISNICNFHDRFSLASAEIPRCGLFAVCLVLRSYYFEIYGGLEQTVKPFESLNDVAFMFPKEEEGMDVTRFEAQVYEFPKGSDLQCEGGTISLLFAFVINQEEEIKSTRSVRMRIPLNRATSEAAQLLVCKRENSHDDWNDAKPANVVFQRDLNIVEFDVQGFSEYWQAIWNGPANAVPVIYNMITNLIQNLKFSYPAVAVISTRLGSRVMKVGVCADKYSILEDWRNCENASGRTIAVEDKLNENLQLKDEIEVEVEGRFICKKKPILIFNSNRVFSMERNLVSSESSEDDNDYIRFLKRPQMNEIHCCSSRHIFNEMTRSQEKESASCTASDGEGNLRFFTVPLNLDLFQNVRLSDTVFWIYLEHIGISLDTIIRLRKLQDKEPDLVVLKELFNELTDLYFKQRLKRNWCTYFCKRSTNVDDIIRRGDNFLKKEVSCCPDVLAEKLEFSFETVATLFVNSDHGTDYGSVQTMFEREKISMLDALSLGDTDYSKLSWYELLRKLEHHLKKKDVHKLLGLLGKNMEEELRRGSSIITLNELAGEQPRFSVEATS